MFGASPKQKLLQTFASDKDTMLLRKMNSLINQQKLALYGGAKILLKVSKQYCTVNDLPRLVSIF